MTAVKLLIAGLVVWGLWRVVVSAADDFRRSDFTLADVDVAGLAAAVLLYLAGTMPMAWFWHRVLISMGQRPRLWDAIRAHFIGHLGKYVPGKALVVILRTALIRGRGVDTTVAALAVFVETLTMMAVGAFLAAASLIFFFPEQRVLTLLAVGLMLAAGIPTIPPLFRLAVRILKVRKLDADLDGKLAGLDGRLMITGWLCNLVGWSLFGLSLWAVLRAMPGSEQTLRDPWSELPLMTAAVGLAIVAGFLSRLPGGIGVRELVLDALMTPRFGQVTALVSAVLVRLVWMIAEAALAAVFYLSFRHRSVDRHRK